VHSREFYTQLNRILKRDGKLYHYVGDPDSRAAGKHFQGILRRLQDAGFEGAATDYDAHGVVSSLGDAKSSLGDAKSSLGDAKS
jgi:predicted methyltransferase